MSLCLLAGATTACVELSDPASPCGAIELGDADPGVHVARRFAPVLAMTGSSEPFVLHFDCPDGATDESDCTLRQLRLADLERGNAIMITTSGRFVVATDRGDNMLRWYDLQSPQYHETQADTLVSNPIPLNTELPSQLIASLRDSDWIIGRDAQGGLRRYLPGQFVAHKIAPDHDAMKIVATGEQHVIGRVQNGQEDEIFILPIDDALPHVRRGPIPVMRSGEITRVAVTPGDASVAITVRGGADAETFVFAIPTEAAAQAVLIDRFSGEMLSGRQAMADLAGMRPVSPDGSHLAFRTARGSLALRNLETNSACLVQTAEKDELRMAGFSAEGTLYFETERRAGHNQVMSWEPATRRLSELGSTNEGFRLVELPAQESGHPWAIGVRDGVFAALQPDADAFALKLDDAVFLPRDGAEVWALNSEAVDRGRDVGVRRIAPTWDGPAHRYDFAIAEQMGAVRLAGPEYVCISSGSPGAWAYQCDSANDRSFMSSTPVPSSEDSGGSSTPGPEIPSNNEGSSCGAGIPYGAGPSCHFLTPSGCCFEDRARACSSAGCDVDLCVTTAGDDYTEVYCGNQAGTAP